MPTPLLLLLGFLRMMPTVGRSSAFFRRLSRTPDGLVERAARICVASSALLLGGQQAISGASAGVAGLVKYSGNTAVSLPTNTIAEPVGQPFRYRITVYNPGSDVTKNYYNCLPLPPGLTMNTNLGAAGYITGIPTEVGSYTVTLLAGNTSYPIPATAPATLTIYPANLPPEISEAPKSQVVIAGRSASFSVLASGTPPLSYQWRENGIPLAAATNLLLSWTNVSSIQSGDYDVIVTNPFGSITSIAARLDVQEPLIVTLQLTQSGIQTGAFHFTVTGPILTNYVIWTSIDQRTWSPRSTNRVIDGRWRFVEPIEPKVPTRFFRATISP